jgi:hypothetical protein
MGKTELITYKVRNETRLPTLPNLIQYSTAILSKSNKAGRIKGIQIGIKRLKLFLFAYHIILYMKDRFIKYLLGLRTPLNVSGLKINTQNK